MIKIEFPADRTDIALAMSKALASIGGCPVVQVSGHSRYGAVAKAAIDKMEFEQPLARTAIDDSNFAAMMERTPVQGGDGTPTIAEDNPQIADNHEAITPEEMGAIADACLEAATDERLDEKGVPFNKERCSNAAKPFYATGSTKGQWKRLPGSDQGMYDAWYAEALDQVPTATMETEAPEIDVAAAFTPAAPEQAKGPTNGGEFFAWVASMQSAGHLTQDDINAAYPALGIDSDKIWSQPLEIQAQMFTALYNHLSVKVPA
jgi:hypothetical protein